MTSERGVLKSGEATSSQGQCGKFIFGHSGAGVVVSGDSEIVPCGRVQIQHDEIATGFDAVRHQSPVLISSVIQKNKKMLNTKMLLKYYGMWERRTFRDIRLQSKASGSLHPTKHLSGV